MTKSIPKKCPKCDGTSIAEIAYGNFSDEDADSITKAIDAGEIILGGCCVGEDDPKWGCNKCGHMW